jgi:hypothetical protein
VRYPSEAQQKPIVSLSGLPDSLPLGEIDDAVRAATAGGKPLYRLDEARICEPVDSEPPPAWRLWLAGVRPDDLQIGTSAQADEEIRGAPSLMTAATHWLHPSVTGEPRNRLHQAARHRVRNVIHQDQASHQGLASVTGASPLMRMNPRLHLPELNQPA